MSGGRRRVLVMAATILTVLVTVLLPTGVAGASPTVPDAPGSVSAVALEGSATVSWQPPASAGSSAVTGYVITTTPAGAGGAALQVPGTSLVATVGGLADGTNYQFTVAATNASGTGPASGPTAGVVPAHPGGSYVPLAPYRICDTRTGPTASVLTGTDAQCSGKTLGAGDTLQVQVAGTDPTGTTTGGVPTGGVTAVVVNVTATNTTASSYLTVYPSGSPRPVASSLNWTPGGTVPNLVQVALGTGGSLSVYNPAGSTDVVIDVEGYVTTAAPATTGLYRALAPYRICDTRTGVTASVLTGTDAQCSGKTLGAGGSLQVQVAGTDPTGTTSGGVPSSGVTAVVVNVTVTDTTAPSYLTVFPTGSAQPVASNLNWVAGQTVPNRVEVPVGPGGTIEVYNAAGQTDVVVDVTGYYTSSTTGPGSYFSGFTPSRICDTRAGNPSGLSGPAAQCTGETLGPGATLPVQVTGVGGVPPESTATPAVAAVLNVTVTDPTAAGYLTVWPAGSAQPVASDLNWVAGETVANLVPVTLGTSGQVDVYNPAGQTDVVIDVVGYQSGANVVPPSTVALSTQSLGLLTAVASDQSSLTFSGSDGQLAGLVPGDVVTAGVTALAPTGLLLRVTGVSPSGSGLVVTTAPASLTEVAPQGSFDLAGGTMNLLNPPAALTPNLAGPTANGLRPLTSPPPNDMNKFLQSVTCGGSANPPQVSYSAGFTTFTVTPYFHASWNWGLPPSVSVTTSLRLDETYQAQASITEAGTNSVSVSCTTSVAIPGLNNLMLSDPIPITIGPVDFTLTPVLQASLGVTATGSLSGTTGFSATQSAYATAGVRYANGSFSPVGGTGCDPPVKSGTPLCTTMTGSNAIGASLQLSVGPTFSLVGAIDAIPGSCSVTTHFCYVGGPVIGPELSLALSAEGTLQNSAPIWSVGLNLTAGVGFTANWSVGPITLNLTYQDNLVNATDTLAHAIEIDTSSLPAANAESLYSATLQASGGSTPYTWAFTSGSSPPVWLSVSSAGVLSGAPPSSAADTTVTVPVQVTDASGVTATDELTLQIGSAFPSIQVFTATPARLPAAGGPVVLVWSAANASNCTVTASPTVAGLPQAAPCTTVTGGTETATVTLPAVATGTTSTDVFTLTATGAAGTPPATDTVSAIVGVLPSWGPAATVVSPVGNPGAASCSSATFCMAVDGSGNAITYDGSTWSAPQNIESASGLGLDSVSCPSATFCMAVDGSGNALTYNGSTWSAPQNIESASGSGNLDSVSCPSATFCIAVDSGGTALTYNGSTWSAPQNIESASGFVGGLGSVSCPSATFCMAVDGSGNAITYNGSTWSALQNIESASGLVGGLDSVSCPSATFCMAVDSEGNALTFNGASWSTAVPVVGVVGLPVVTCPSATFCEVVDRAGNASTFDGQAWTSPRRADPSTGTLVAVSCPSTSFCVAVDDYGNAYTFNGSTWSAPLEVDPTSAVRLTSVSCASVAFCVAADGYDAYVYDGSTWSGPHQIGTPRQGVADGGAVSCPSASFCMAVDFNGTAVSYNGSSWSPPVALTAASLSSVSCPSASYCMAVDLAGNAFTFNGSSWSAPQGSGLPTTFGVSASCPTTTFCTAVSWNVDFSTGATTLYAATYNGVAWTTPVVADSNISLDSASVSCASAAFCMAADGADAVAYTGSTWGGPVSSPPDGPQAVSCPSASFCVAIGIDSANTFSG